METAPTPFLEQDEVDDLLPSVDVFLTSQAPVTSSSAPSIPSTLPQRNVALPLAPTVSVPLDGFDLPYEVPAVGLALAEPAPPPGVSAASAAVPAVATAAIPVSTIDEQDVEADFTIDTTIAKNRISTIGSNSASSKPVTSLEPLSSYTSSHSPTTSEYKQDIGRDDATSEQRRSLEQAFALSEDSWAYDFLFRSEDTDVAALVMNPMAFRKSCYAEVQVNAMEAGPRVEGDHLIDFKHKFNWLLVPGFNNKSRVAGLLASETVEDTSNISQSMPKFTMARFIRDDETSEMLILTHIQETGDAKLVWIKNSAPYRQERKYFRLKYKPGERASPYPEEIIFSVYCVERVSSCFRCMRLSTDCTCSMKTILRSPRHPLDFDSFEYNMEVHDGNWHGCSEFYMRMKQPDVADRRRQLATVMKAKGFADHRKMKDLRSVVQQMWLASVPLGMNVSGTNLIGWRQPPEQTEAEKKALRKKLRNRMSAARSNEKRRIRNLNLKAGLKEVRELKPKLEERFRQLVDENRKLKTECINAGIMLPQFQWQNQ